MKKIERKRRAEKLIVSGQFIEFVKYSNPVDVDDRDHIVKRKEKVEDREKRDDNLMRARQKIRRYIWANESEYTKFLTLTYKEPCFDYDKVKNDYKNFVRNMKRSGYDLKGRYLWILEHQKERGLKESNEGSYHIHAVLFYNDFIPFDVINKCWSWGITDIHSIRKINNLGSYVCKYLTKEDFILNERNSYHIGRGLFKPVELSLEGYSGVYLENQYIFDLLRSYSDLNYSNSSEYEFDLPDGSKFVNTVHYQQGVYKKMKIKDVNLDIIKDMLSSLPENSNLECIDFSSDDYIFKFSQSYDEDKEKKYKKALKDLKSVLSLFDIDD